MIERRDPTPTPDAFEPERVLLLVGDPADPVARALLDGRARTDWPLTALSTQDLLDGVVFDDAAWTIAGQRVEPRHTAVVNRLPLSERLDAGPQASGATIARQALWGRLRIELGRFGYASSLPTATSLMGCRGSLLDQWQDLPRLVPGLRVPVHSTPSLPRALNGTVFAVDRWTPYSLGKPLREALAAGLPAASLLDYVVPEGRLVHLAQVGASMVFANAPPTMTAPQQQAMLDLGRALAAASPIRVHEHAFFLGRGEPVLYSTFPVPVMSGGHPLFPELLQRGLCHDIRTRGRLRPG